MAGYTNYAHRELLRILGGADLIATEMVSARSFIELEQHGLEPPSRLWGIREEPRPLAVQIWDNDPGMLAFFAAKLAFDFRVSVIDINFGCPARQIAGKSASGSFLLQYPERIGNIVQKVVSAAAPVPVTAKIRLGRTRDTLNAVEVASAVESAGAAGITVHGRTAADMYRGKADWEEIAKVKTALKKIPLIGNGDICTAEEGVFRLRNYPVDGIMIGRGSIARPWIFRQIRQLLREEPVDPEPAGKDIAAMIIRQFTALRRQFQEHTALALIRKTVCHYAAGQSGARKFRNDICSVKDTETFFRLTARFFDTAFDLPDGSRTGDFQ
ncbi:MAG: tRNA-dihydrouridine synthase [Planctomycetaceae bacterium]|nr:tRNA-dihydrouridine synthase [Planctomycetaceae bacterium]